VLAFAGHRGRDSCDHDTDYLRRILVDIWGADLTVEIAALLHNIAEEAAAAADMALALRHAA
jgi:FMN-dependent NADH-azoreductase